MGLNLVSGSDMSRNGRARRNFRLSFLVQECMRRVLAVLVLPFILAGCAGLPSGQPEDEDDFRVPLICLPKHKEIPCAAAVEEGVSYPFTLQTHCGAEWAYFDGHFWVVRPRMQTPSNWGNFEAGTMVLTRPGVAVFVADAGGEVRFVPARPAYLPPPCV
jgi:hypothetical protein